MVFEEGALILVDFTAKIKDTGETFDTTFIDSEDPDGEKRSEPRLISIGKPNFSVLGSLNDALSNSKEGDTLSLEIPPEKAFGQRRPDKVRVISLRKLGEDAEHASVGKTVEVNGRKGVIRFISSGRVTVDYNHRYAGKTIVFDAMVKKLLTDNREKITEIQKYRMGDDTEPIHIDSNTLYITIPESLYDSTTLYNKKHMIQSDVFQFVPQIRKIIFTETYLNPLSPGPDDSSLTGDEDFELDDDEDDDLDLFDDDEPEPDEEEGPKFDKDAASEEPEFDDATEKEDKPEPHQ